MKSVIVSPFWFTISVKCHGFELRTLHINVKVNRLSPNHRPRPTQTIVCKHWLRGLCKKGDQCEFLHEYDMSKMPECYFYTRFSE